MRPYTHVIKSLKSRNVLDDNLMFNPLYIYNYSYIIHVPILTNTANNDQIMTNNDQIMTNNDQY